MPLRLIEAVLPAASLPVVDQWSEGKPVVDRWDEMLNDEKALVRLLVDANEVEPLLDELMNRFANIDGFRLMLLPVEATLPRQEEAKDKESAAAQNKSPERLSREELFSQVSESANISNVYMAQVVIATIVAAIGLMRDDTAVIIGAMVIAPLLGPNMSLSLATTLGDKELALRSLKANAVGLALALLAALAVGFGFTINPNTESIASRTTVSWGDIVLAFASGCAGVLAYTSRAPSALIGVMVAVALLPPFSVFGLLLASGEFESAVGALLLTTTNVICVNLAGVTTFYAQGLRPHSWWDLNRAKRATTIALITWALLLAILIVLIFVDWEFIT